MSRTITNAIYKKDNMNKSITLKDITKKSYKEIYRGHLFCPHDGCNARIVYSAGGENIAPHFKTWKIAKIAEDIKDEHVLTCPYSIQHQLEEKIRRRTDSGIVYQLSSSHIKSILKNAYRKKFKSDNESDTSDIVSKSTKKSPIKKSKTDVSVNPIGVAGLGIDGAKEADEKEPPVYRKDIDNVTNLDYNSVLCIEGYAVNFEKKNNYAYINLEDKNSRKCRVLFNEAFSVNSVNQAMYDNIHIVGKYINHLNSSGEKAYCCCVGKIIKDEYEVSVIPEAWDWFTINDLGFYRILSELNKQNLD